MTIIVQPKPSLWVLLIEDNPGDARLVREALKESTLCSFDLVHVERLDMALSLMVQKKFDVVLTDLGLPDAQGFEAVTQLQAAATNMPLVVLTTINETMGLEAVKQGAQDYLVKDHLTSRDLTRALLYAIERKKAQLRSQFTVIVSHELRTPLAVIKEGISLVAEELSITLTRSQKDNFNIVLANVNRLERLINNVLNFSKLDAGKTEFTWHKTDLREIVQKVHDFIIPAALKKGLHLRLELPAQPVIAVQDTDQIQQVLINLLDNAIKFTHQGEITLRLIQSNHVVRFEVEDAGIGIKPEDQSKVFDFYSQGSYSGEHRTGGTGLGLAICKLIVTSHGGDISLESQVGKGTKFKVSFPDTPAASHQGALH